jgi:glycine oxidase
VPSQSSENGVQRLRGPAPVDVLIVGAGVIGLACAWRVSQRGLRVRVLEREQPGVGASRVAAGMLAPVGEATWGEEALLEMALAAHRAWPRFAAELAELTGLDLGYQPLGALHVALDRDEAEELRRRYELMRELGLEAEWLRPQACRELEPGLSPSCAAGVHAPHEAAADPRALVPALRRAAELAGAELLAPAEVNVALIDRDRLAGVLTADGTEHRAAHTVLAAGSWSGASGWLPRDARPPVRPVKGQILTLLGAAHERVCERIVASERVYMVPRADGRLIVGATVEERGFDVQVTAGGVLELLREAYRALPDVSELELAEAEAALRPGTPDNAPIIGRGALDGLLLATGHFRNGILLAPLTAEVIAALVTGGDAPPEAAGGEPGRFASAPPRLRSVPG